jgi:hypothetical protein
MTKEWQKTGRWLGRAFLCLTAMASLCSPPHAGAWTATVNAVWSAPADPTVAGYYVYYGTNSGVYPFKLNAGTNTTLSIPGLVPGGTYYFATTSYNSGGTESTPTPEASFVVPGTLTLSLGTGNQMRFQFPVAANHYYELQYSTNLTGWTDLWVTSTETTNTSVEYDQPATNSISGQYYRLRLH